MTCLDVKDKQWKGSGGRERGSVLVPDFLYGVSAYNGGGVVQTKKQVSSNTVALDFIWRQSMELLRNGEPEALEAEKTVTAWFAQNTGHASLQQSCVFCTNMAIPAFASEFVNI